MLRNSDSQGEIIYNQHPVRVWFASPSARQFLVALDPQGHRNTGKQIPWSRFPWPRGGPGQTGGFGHNLANHQVSVWLSTREIGLGSGISARENADRDMMANNPHESGWGLFLRLLWTKVHAGMFPPSMLDGMYVTGSLEFLNR